MADTLNNLRDVEDAGRAGELIETVGESLNQVEALGESALKANGGSLAATAKQLQNLGAIGDVLGKLGMTVGIAAETVRGATISGTPGAVQGFGAASAGIAAGALTQFLVGVQLTLTVEALVGGALVAENGVRVQFYVRRG